MILATNTIPFPSPRKKSPKTVKGVYEKEPGSGIWWIRFADQNGRIRREKVGSRGSAISLYQKRKTEVLDGRKFPERLRAKGVSFSELAQDALDYSKVHKISHATDANRIKPILEAFGARSADSIQPLEIERWLNGQAQSNKWKPATANRYKALFSLIFRLGLENGKILQNPAKLVRRRREDNGRIRWLDEAEEKKLRATISEKFPLHMPELDIALNTGLRKSEQYRLTWERVDFDRRSLTIPQTKNGDPRHIPLNSAAVNAFEILRTTSSGTGPVFVGRLGDQLTNSRHWFDKAASEAGIHDFTWHCLRHTFASRLIMRGVDLRTAQELMGHKTIQMTCRYAHLAPQHQLDAVERLCTPVAATSSKTAPRLSKSRTAARTLTRSNAQHGAGI